MRKIVLPLCRYVLQGRGMPRPCILLPTPYFLFRILRTTSYALFASRNPHTA
ncbi:MAG: hypothetical protein AMXMBFR16_05930 [Candidatus Uhrbacteria bacterium]